jgi:hypothetical protein
MGNFIKDQLQKQLVGGFDRSKTSMSVVGTTKKKRNIWDDEFSQEQIRRGQDYMDCDVCRHFNIRNDSQFQKPKKR